MPVQRMTLPQDIQLSHRSMRSALLYSLAFHLIVGFVSMQIVRFRHVRFVPRQIYTVQIVSAEFQKPPVEQQEPQPEAEVITPQEEEPEEIEPPPVKPKKKPKKKEEPKPRKKVIPTTELRRIDQPNQQPDQQPATGDVAFDVEDFPFAYYIAAMKRKIAAYWRVPAASGKTSLYCRIYFRVTRNGGIESPAVEESSGSFLFDQAAQRAVVQASPLPPLPTEFRDDYLGVHFSFAYEKR